MKSCKFTITIAKMAFRVQIVGPGNKRIVVNELVKDSTIGELKGLIEQNLQIPPDQQLLLTGFPPKEVVGEDCSSLVEGGIENGSRITVKVQGTVKKGVVQGTGSDVIFTIPKNTNGHMVRREMPGDNSCLFHSVAYTCLDKKRDYATELRQKAVELVRAHPNEFTTQVLGRPIGSYTQMILDPKMWGGAIELQVFSRYFETEILSFDYAYLREDHFGDGMGYKKRVFLIYTGQHYDAIVWSPFPSAPEHTDKTIFSSLDEYAWQRARHYVEFLHAEAVKADSSLTLQKEWRRDRDKRRAVPGHSMVDSSSSSSSGWTCSSCTFGGNADSSTSCEMCALPKDSSASAGSSGSMLDDVMNFFSGSSAATGNWPCPACTFSNSSSDNTCAMCSTARN